MFVVQVCLIFCFCIYRYFQMVVTRASRDFCSYIKQLPVSRCNNLHLSRPMTKLCTSSLFSISLAEFYSSNNLKLTKNCDYSDHKQYQDSIDLTEARTLNPQVVIESFFCIWILIQVLCNKACHWMKVVKESLFENADGLQRVRAVLAAAAVLTASFHKMPLTRLCHHPRMVGMGG